jgi:hypothetical protein
MKEDLARCWDILEEADAMLRPRLSSDGRLNPAVRGLVTRTCTLSLL